MLKFQIEAILLTNRVSQKEVCRLSTRINFDAHKCDVARIMAQIDSLILAKSETLLKWLRCE